MFQRWSEFMEQTLFTPTKLYLLLRCTFAVQGKMRLSPLSASSRRSDVVTIGSFQAGVAANAIPREAVLKGTARWLDAAIGETINQGIRRLADSIAQAYGTSVEVEMHMVAPTTINDAAATALACKAWASVAGANQVIEMAEPVMGAEDFAYMLEAKQGAYIMLGSKRPGGLNPMLHHPAFDFNDAVLSTGAAYWATLIEQQLELA